MSKLRSLTQRSLGGRAIDGANPTEVAEGGSSASAKPRTTRVATLNAAVVHGRPMDCRNTSSTTMTSTSVWSICMMTNAWRGVRMNCGSDLKANRCWARLSRPPSLSLAPTARRLGPCTELGRARRLHSSTIQDMGNRSAGRPSVDHIAEETFGLRFEAPRSMPLTFMARYRGCDIVATTEVS